MAHRGTLPAGRFQNRQTFALEAVAGFMRALVPSLAGVVFLKSRSGIDDQKRPHAIRMRATEGKRHVAPKGKPADDGGLGADRVE